MDDFDENWENFDWSYSSTPENNIGKQTVDGGKSKQKTRINSMLLLFFYVKKLTAGNDIFRCR